MNMTIHEINEELFSKYGRVLNFCGTEELAKALDGIPVPESGNKYEASVDALENCAIMEDIKRVCFGSMEIESGYCNGNGHKLNALEYHKCSEVNFTTTGMVLLLALPEDIKDGYIDSSKVVAFNIPANVLIELHPLVMHFAPCRVSEGGFKCLVVLEKGTNLPLERVNTSADGEEKLLWMKNKWMTCHAESPQAEKGAFVGITGVNIDTENCFQN